MCVIMIAEEKKPTPDLIFRAAGHNGDGMGIAYRETDPLTGQTVVRWKKALTAEQVCGIVETIELPFVLHARIASEGGVHGELTHPFEISATPNTGTEGTTTGSVLFHNGHWSGWKEHLKAAVINSGTRLPGGRYWSDTKAMAFLCAIFGAIFMNLIEEKGVEFGPEEINLFWGRTGWVDVEGILCSNQIFLTGRKVGFANGDVTGAYEPTNSQATQGIVVTKKLLCKHPQCDKYRVGENSEFCFEHLKDRVRQAIKPQTPAEHVKLALAKYDASKGKEVEFPTGPFARWLTVKAFRERKAIGRQQFEMERAMWENYQKAEVAARRDPHRA